MAVDPRYYSGEHTDSSITDESDTESIDYHDDNQDRKEEQSDTNKKPEEWLTEDNSASRSETESEFEFESESESEPEHESEFTLSVNILQQEYFKIAEEWKRLSDEKHRLDNYHQYLKELEQRIRTEQYNYYHSFSPAPPRYYPHQHHQHHRSGPRNYHQNHRHSYQSHNYSRHVGHPGGQQRRYHSHTQQHQQPSLPLVNHSQSLQSQSSWADRVRNGSENTGNTE